MKLVATANTFLKVRPAPASTLEDATQRVAFPAGKSYEIVSTTGIHKSHIGVLLRYPLFGKKEYFVYEGHAKLEDDSIKLDVPYYPQTDNYTQPDRTCNSSACAMVAKFLGANITGDDDYLRRVIAIGDTTDHGVQTKVLNSLGIESRWRTDLGFDELDWSLEQGYPVVIGILHRGSETAPTGGHMIVVIGRTNTGDFICHDPFGSLYLGYQGSVYAGKGIIYTRKTLDRRWTVDGEADGWGRIFVPAR